ncbi:hypothetical protein NDU88_005210 [Pleurodeles waltl]|uniref:Uncharacterized protein n=1 Tax=Pleurodeles waltl TaxID=8319 RepID=A0AAV7M9Q9_PLEWA|nr:hypothetical protein NDU88_005210 [Pleurodeles waltl]
MVKPKPTKPEPDDGTQEGHSHVHVALKSEEATLKGYKHKFDTILQMIMETKVSLEILTDCVAINVTLLREEHKNLVERVMVTEQTLS